MIKVKRLEQITKLLESQGTVEVTALSRLFKVTEKTVREDLSYLEKIAVATRVHGGAVVNNKGSEVYPLFVRKKSNIPEKESIAHKALELINDQDIIILDAGTTTQHLAMILDKWVTVITNDPVIINELKDRENIDLYATGGHLKRIHGSSVLIGRDAIRMISNYHVNKYFMGVSSIDFERGLMLFSTDEVNIKQAMLRAAGEVICLADYSKFHTTALISFAQLDQLNCIVTDRAVKEEDVKFLQNKNINVIIA